MTAPASSDMDLSGQTAFVTGAARGIGAGIAVSLARAGALVVAADILDVADTVGQIVADGGQADGRQMDVSDRMSVDAAVAGATALTGRLDILVCAAGIMPLGPVVADPAQWDRVIAVNLTGVQNCLAAVWDRMAAAGYGKIVLVSSIAAHAGGSLAGPEYIAAKAGLLGLCRHAARNGGPLGIYCNAVTPGVIETDMNRDIGKPDPQTIPLQRLGTAEDVAGPVRFLCSPASNYVTGAIIPVNGGQLFSA